MHSYLRAVGFSDISKKEMKEIINEIVRDYDEKIIVDEDNHRLFAEISKSFGYDCGITVCGEYDENNEFQEEYYFPYFRGTGITTREDIIVERRSEKECFSGACDDVRIGVTLIFYLANAGKYLSEKYKNSIDDKRTTVTLSGLSTEGKILLPIRKNMEQIERDHQVTRKREQLIHEARNGNEEAMENLTMEDMDTYSMISRRIANEDIFSIVDSYFMPYGMECDRYNVMGEIEELVETKNELTGEKLYQMTINCNELQFDICMNKQDLMGEPQVGRRFKGVIWLQGNLNFV
ncbi:DUF3881 family protein [bacterium]|nr:DUF3881 family protein [bacterium]MDY3021043.1 DUF3881 family protein [Oliverpabstia sp.]